MLLPIRSVNYSLLEQVIIKSRTSRTSRTPRTSRTSRISRTLRTLRTSRTSTTLAIERDSARDRGAATIDNRNVYYCKRKITLAIIVVKPLILVLLGSPRLALAFYNHPHHPHHTHHHHHHHHHPYSDDTKLSRKNSNSFIRRSSLHSYSLTPLNSKASSLEFVASFHNSNLNSFSSFFSSSSNHYNRRHKYPTVIRKSKMSDEEYGNDDFLADFDVDAAVAAADNNAQANHEQTQTQTQTQTFQTKSKFSTGIQTSPSDHEASAGFNSRKSAQMPALRYNSKKRQQSDTTTIVTSISPSSSQPNMKQMRLTSENENKNKKYRNDLNGESIDETTKSELTQTLQDYFGHKSYRPGQLSIIQSILKGQDAAVFWSTGAGKSICYQIPPLHLNQIAVVISPLISLMEDQVSKLNGLGNHGHSHQKDIAVFLGSAQTDPMAQQKALNGDYRIIYCTPEKLTYAGGEFLNDLGDMHRKGQRTASAGSGSDNHNGICLVAVDESHCVRYALCLFDMLFGGAIELYYKQCIVTFHSPHSSHSTHMHAFFSSAFYLLMCLYR